MTTILIKKKDTAGAPAPGDLTNAAGGTEIAVNTATKRIYTKDSGGNVVELGTNSTSSTIDQLTVVTSTTLSYGTANQVQYLNASKLLVGSANLTFDGTTLSVNGVSVGQGAGNLFSNTAVGASALAANTTGTNNTASGWSALDANTAGNNNTALGSSTLGSNLTGNNNTAVGMNALLFSTAGSNNTVVGVQALYKNTANNNTAVGYNALYSSTTGPGNTATGNNSLYSNLTGSYNTAVGFNALYANTSGSYNTAIGYEAGGLGSIGGSNVYLGYRAGYYETGSDSFYVDNQNRANTAGDKAGALLYGTFSATPASQTLKVNAALTATYGVTLSGGTANGVAYLDGSKVLTTGSVLTFDGTNLGLGTASPVSIATYGIFTPNGTSGSAIYLQQGGATKARLITTASELTLGTTVATNPIVFELNNAEQMRLTSTGLGIGTSSPITKLSNTGTAWSGGIATDGLVWRSTQNDWTAAVLGTPATGAGYGLRVHTLGTTSSDYPFSVSSGSGAGSILMTVNGAGNLGIGTSSPTEKLTVNGNIKLGTSGTTYIYGPSTTGRSFISNSDSTAYIGIYGSSYGSSLDSVISFVAGTSNVMTYNASGNLGLGVTPSAWGSTFKALQIGMGGSIFARTADQNRIGITANAYFDTSFKYIGTGQASFYDQDDGSHFWYNAPSGTAGNAITFTQAMTLDANGTLLVGTANSAGTSGVGVALNPTANGVRLVSAVSTNASETFSMYSTGASAYRFYVDWGGTISATSIVITAISDQRLKENVRDIDTGLNAIMALKPRRFDWKEGKGQDKKNAAGFIAQEFESVFPECVGTSKAGEDGIEYKNINHETLIPALVKAIQEQQALILSLTTRLTALEAK